MVAEDPRRKRPLPLGHDALEAMIVTAGGQPSELLSAAFRESTGYNHGRTREAIRRMPGYAEAVARHAATLRHVVAGPGAGARLEAVRMLDPLDDPTLSLFAEELADYATSSSSQVRRAAGPLASRCGGAIVEPLKRLAVEGKPEQRLHAFRLLWSVTDDTETRTWAQKCAAADRAPSVQALAEEWASAPAEAETATESLAQTHPRPVIEWRVPASDDLATLLAAHLGRGQPCHRQRQRAHRQGRRAVERPARLHPVLGKADPAARPEGRRAGPRPARARRATPGWRSSQCSTSSRRPPPGACATRCSPPWSSSTC